MAELWDGHRPLSRRNVLRRDDVNSGGLYLRYVSERVDTPTDWCRLEEARYRMYVFRGGTLNSIHTGADWGAHGHELPNAGDMWIVPAGEWCSSVVQGTEAVEYCEIAIPSALLGDPMTMPRIKGQDPFVYALTERIAETVGREDVMSGLLADSLVEVLRLHIADTWTVNRPRLTRRPDRDTLDTVTQRRLVEFMADALDADITLESLAAMAELPVGAFIKAFVAAFHVTPYQFLLNRRIERAKSLLLTTTCSIAEVSAAVGFSAPNYFATAFRRVVGVSPTTYRRGR